VDKDRTERVAKIVESALERDPAERARYLDQTCGQDVDLRQEVESLLGFQKIATDFMEKPAYQVAADAFADSGGELRSGERVAGYEIVSLVGEGGMGEVYLAEDISLGRQVAIKLLKFGLGSGSIIRHFHEEERILASLTHPNIARLYGGAVTTAGLPYFVMEYVDGPRLDQYWRDHNLPIRDRVKIFVKICAAVSYAHQHLIIHRDLKPANIRVTAEGEPKLLDFGIAKLLDPATSAVSEMTVTFAAVMTPDYASPEQVRGETMTTASDVYSLGIVLYELLTGLKPYKVDKRSPTTIAKSITDQEATRPSTALARVILANPQSAIGNPKTLSGDLDNIVLKALRKEPQRRYASVAEFSEDIRRYLEGLPVIAQRDTFNYRASKFIRRNKIVVSATVLVLLATVVALVVSLQQAKNARHQRDVAEQINIFIQDMLGAAAPEAKGTDVKVVDVLNEASRRAQNELASQPDVMANVLLTLGRTYISLGQYSSAISVLRSALDASRRANGELNSTTANTLGWLGMALDFNDQASEGGSISREAVRLQRKLHPEGNVDLAVAFYGLGLNSMHLGDAKSAELYLQQAGDLVGKYLGKSHGYYLAALTAQARVREALGDPAGAERLCQNAIQIGNHVEPRYRIYLAQASDYLGQLLTRQGRYDEAEKALRESQKIYSEIMGGPNSNTPNIQADLARLSFLKGDYPTAEIEYRKALDDLPKFFPPEHSAVLGSKTNFGLTLTRIGKAVEGEHYLRDVLSIRKKILSSDDLLIPYTESALGECLTAQGRFAEAEPLLLRGYEKLKSKLDAKDRRVIEARQRLLRLYQAWGKPQQAANYAH
jgi:eukaryotic-like serine/threonine-protein kinase